MRIGELAQMTGVGVPTLRFYEQQDLLASPGRQENGYRTYTKRHVEQILFIRRCRTLGLSLEEIRRLQSYQDEPYRSCAAINAMLDAHIQQVRSQMLALQVLEAQLVGLRARCDDKRQAADCGILSGINDGMAGRACS